MRAIEPVARMASQAIATWAPAVAEVVRTAQVDWNRLLKGTEALGALGWTMPFDATLVDLRSLVDAASDASSADAAFEAYYLRNEGAARRDLIADLLTRADLEDWRPLLTEVAACLEDQRFRVAVPALLSIFEGVAHRWTKDFWTARRRAEWFNSKISGLAQDSFDLAAWTAMRAFVEALYARASDTRPVIMNRHWILHGKGLPEASQIDCLRLLQAIHTAVELVKDD